MGITMDGSSYFNVKGPLGIAARRIARFFLNFCLTAALRPASVSFAVSVCVCARVFRFCSCVSARRMASMSCLEFTFSVHKPHLHDE